MCDLFPSFAAISLVLISFCLCRSPFSCCSFSVFFFSFCFCLHWHQFSQPFLVLWCPSITPSHLLRLFCWRAFGVLALATTAMCRNVSARRFSGWICAFAHVCAASMCGCKSFVFVVCKCECLFVWSCMLVGIVWVWSQFPGRLFCVLVHCLSGTSEILKLTRFTCTQQNTDTMEL